MLKNGGYDEKISSWSWSTVSTPYPAKNSWFQCQNNSIHSIGSSYL